MTEQTTTPTTTPSTPATPAEAATRLEALTADKDWSAKLLSGDAATARELSDLVAKKSSGDRLDRIIDGSEVPPLMETVHAGEISTRNAMSLAADLKEAGLSEAVVREVFAGEPVTKAEFNAVKQLSEDRYSDPEWVKKLLAGNHAAKRQFLLMQTVLSLGFKEKEAA